MAYFRTFWLWTFVLQNAQGNSRRKKWYVNYYVLVIRDGENINTNWYQKLTLSGRLLNFHSHHPLKYKINTINNLVDRGITLAHKSFHTKNIQKIKMTLIKNNYPRKIINSTIKKKIKLSFEKSFHYTHIHTRARTHARTHKKYLRATQSQTQTLARQVNLLSTYLHTCTLHTRTLW